MRERKEIMERFYIVKNEKYLESIKRDQELSQKRNAFVKKFFEENGIDGSTYILHGNGRMNIPFQECDKKGICLEIEDTDNNNEQYGSQFKVSRHEGMQAFRKSSSLLKKFQDECIQNETVINLFETRTGDYFKGIEMGGYSHSLFMSDGELLLRVTTERYNRQDFSPKFEGFNEIKASEFFTAKERYEVSKGEK